MKAHFTRSFLAQLIGLRVHYKVTLSTLHVQGEVNCNTIQYNTYLILAECEVRTASYGPSFFLHFIAHASTKRAGQENKEGKNEDP